MKKLAKLFSLLLVFAMAFSLFAACSNDGEEAVENNNEGTQTEPRTKASRKKLLLTKALFLRTRPTIL